MRLLLVLLAVLGLFANPVSAAAARVACRHAMSGMPGMTDTHQDGQKASSAHPPGKTLAAKTCAQLCAGIGALDVAAEAPPVSVPFVLSAADHAPARVASVHPFEPAGADRPPRHIA
jgi:hypothetical protein